MGAGMRGWGSYMQEEPGGWSAEIAGLWLVKDGQRALEPSPASEGLQVQGSQVPLRQISSLSRGVLPKPVPPPT